MKEYTAVILAAGSSKRLGFNKLILKIDGEPVIRKAVLPFLSAGVSRVLVVTGTDSQDLKEALMGCSVEYVLNNDHALGMSTSVVAVLPFIDQATGVFFHLGDKPFIEKGILERMVGMFRESRDRIIVPFFEGKKGHPILMDVRRYREEMGSLKGDKGLREIIENHAEDVICIRGDEGSLLDIDTVEDVVHLGERGYSIEKS